MDLGYEPNISLQFGRAAILDLRDLLAHVIYSEMVLFIFSAAYKHADGKKIDGRRVLVDVERARTVKGWRPRRLGKSSLSLSIETLAINVYNL